MKSPMAVCMAVVLCCTASGIVWAAPSNQGHNSETVGPRVWAETQPGQWAGFDTIQAAVDNVMDSGRISVDDGLYTEAISSTAAKSFTVEGQSEAGVVVQTSASQTGAANVFTINAPGCSITLSNLTIRHGDYGLMSSAGNVSVTHCTFYHNGWNGAGLPDPQTSSAAQLAAFYTTYATDGGAIRIENSGNSQIAHCTIYENDRGIRLQDSNNGSIHDNFCHDNIQAGIYLAASTYTGATGCTDANVYDNESCSNMNNGVLSVGGRNNSIRNNNIHDNWNAGVMLWHPAEANLSDNTVNHNNLYAFNGEGNPGDACGGIYVQGSAAAADPNFTCRILNNTISHNLNGAASAATGLYVADNLGPTAIDVNDNSFINHEIDIHVLSTADTIRVRRNSFDGNDIGIQNDDEGVMLNAEGNWWGDETGPGGAAAGSGDAVSDDVDYSPYYCCPEMATGCLRWSEPVRNITQDRCYWTIQAAIDDANAGDTISVWSGTYALTAPLIVDKALTIRGNPAEPTQVLIKAPLYGADKDCFQVLAHNVTIQGFQLIGARETDQELNSAVAVGNYSVPGLQNTRISDCEIAYCSYGIYLYRAQNVTLENNRIWGCKTGTPGYYNGIGIVIYAEGSVAEPQTHDIDIIDNAIFYNDLMGIKISHESVTDGAVDADILIKDNIISNNGGPIDHIAAVDLYRGISSNGNEQNVRIIDNQIFGHVAGMYGRFRADCAAIMVGADTQFDQQWIIQGNKIYDNFRGIYLQNARDMTIRANLVYDNAQGIVVADGNTGYARLNSIRRNTVNAWARWTCPYGHGNGEPNAAVNRGPAAFDARYNYWGHATGPHDPKGSCQTNGVNCCQVATVSNAHGRGDALSENICYCPWLTAPASTPRQPSLPADLDHDGDTDLFDYALLAESWLAGVTW